MTRRRAFDWVLIIVLTGSWAVLFARGIADGLQHSRGQLRIGVSSAAGADVYPIAIWGRPAIEPGDRIVALEDQDLRGSSALYFYDRATKIARDRGSVAISVLRESGTSSVDLKLEPSDYWWFAYLFSAGLMAIGLILVVKAPAWHLARRTFVASWCIAVGRAVFEPSAGPGGTAFEATLSYGAYTVGCALLVWNLQDFSQSAAPIPKWQRAFGLVAGALFAANYVVRYLLPYTAPVGDFVIFAPIAWLAAAGLLALTRAYWRSGPLERRQIRWIVLGFYIALLGSVVGNLASLNRFAFLGLGHGDVVGRLVQPLCGLAVPFGMLAAIVGYRWLDIDRLISATAAYSAAGIVALGVAVAVIPRVAEATSPVLGLHGAVVQWTLTMLLMGASAVVAHRSLRPQLDRRLFAERHQRMSGLEQLLDEVGRCAGAEELWKLVSERIDALLGPESLVAYAREGQAFNPRFSRGSAEPPPYGADSLLVRALERRGLPLAADSSELDPFDRAALETLGVALVMPIATHERLLGFACLGGKGSGDIYTREETAQLAAIAARCAHVLRPSPEQAAETPRVFRHDGELWTLSSGGKEIRLRDMRGLNYLAVLLREPGREFAVVDLVRVTRGPLGHSVHDPELRTARSLGDAGPVLDAQALSAYRKRVTALDSEIADAERCADLGRLERASSEREALFAELESASRGRRYGSDSERARVAVTKAIKVALEKIAERHPELGAHLAATVRRGYLCAYEPDPRDHLVWEV